MDFKILLIKFEVTNYDKYVGLRCSVHGLIIINLNVHYFQHKCILCKLCKPKIKMENDCSNWMNLKSFFSYWMLALNICTHTQLRFECKIIATINCLVCKLNDAS